MGCCVVCATRGGQGSRAAQMHAIEAAKERGDRLVFLYVVDVHSVGDYDEMLVPAVRREFEWVGATLLKIAQQRARRAGLDADTVIRDGNVQQQIEQFLQEADASLLVLGAPRGTTATVFGDDAIEQFANAIEEDTGVPVQVARPGS